MAHTDEESSFFERERDRLTAEITAGFEELLPLSNQLNRRLEEVLGMTREYATIAELWHSFHVLMRNQRDDESVAEDQGAPQGLPGTGGHVLRQSNQEGTKQ